MKKRLLATVLAAVMIISGTQIAGATSLSQARSQKNQAQNKLNSVNSQIAGRPNRAEPMIRCSVCWMQVCFL